MKEINGIITDGYKLKGYKVSFIQKGRCLVVVFDGGDVKSIKDCSKMFSSKKKADEARSKIKLNKMLLKDLIREKNTLQRHDSLPKYKLKENQKRYQDKRVVEKLLSQYKADVYKGSQPHLVRKLKKKRKLELLIPVEDNIDGKTVLYWVRESHLTSTKWVNKIGYEKVEYLLLKTRNTVKKNPKYLLNTPNKEYILSLLS